MINYPSTFVEDQLTTVNIGYYLVLTGGGVRVTIDGVLGDVASGVPQNHIMWNVSNTNFNYAVEGDSFPLGTVPLQNGTISLTLIDDTYLLYDYRNAEIQLWAKHTAFANGILIYIFRVTDMDKINRTITLTVDNKYLSSAHTSKMIDDDIGTKSLPSGTVMYSDSPNDAYRYVQNDINASFAKKLPAPINTDFAIGTIFDETYREALSDMGGIGGGGMILKTGTGAGQSGFKFAVIDLLDFENQYTDTANEQVGYWLNRTGNVASQTGYTVSGYVPLQSNKNYIFDVSNLTGTIRYTVYNSNKKKVGNDTITNESYVRINLDDYDLETGFFRISCESATISNFDVKKVDHVLPNWLKLDVSLPISVTGIKYAFPADGKKQEVYSNSVPLTAIDSPESPHPENHISVFTTQAAFSAHPNKQYDRYLVVNVSTGSVVAKGYDASGLSWSNSNYIVLAHGVWSKWLLYSVNVNDTVRYNSDGIFEVVTSGQNYIVDMSNNKILTDRAFSASAAAVANILDHIKGIPFYPFSGEHLNLPFIEPLDTVAIVDKDNNIYYSFVTSVTFNPYGRTIIENNIKYGTVI